MGEEKALAIYRQLAERQVLALPAGWPVTIYFDPPEAREQMIQWLNPHRPGMNSVAQCAGDLGARLAAAFAEEFARGAAGVIAVGGDCPGLDEGVLCAAHRALTTVDVVLGPATDGGYYLIGLKQPRADLFTGIAWAHPKSWPKPAPESPPPPSRRPSCRHWTTWTTKPAGGSPWKRVSSHHNRDGSVVNNRRATRWAQVIHDARCKPPTAPGE